MDPSMYKAATSGDVGFLEMIRVGEVSSDVLSHKTPKGNNILHLAAESKQINFFKGVPSFEKGFPLLWDINKMGDTPLHIASRVGCVELVDFLIDRAKMLHVQRVGDQERGTTYSESYKKLLRKTNLEMHTALHVAARYGHQGVAISLMKAYPELCCSTNSTKESPLFLATCKGFSNIAGDILKEPSISPSFQGINGVTALHAAVTHTYQGAEGNIYTMVSKYPDTIKEVDSLGWAPLHYAAWRGNLEATGYLIQWDKFSTSYILDKCGMSALHVAAFRGQVKVMQKLIECRPDTCECLNDKGQTILHVAVLGEQSDVVECILKIPELKGLIDQADKEGNTPLHLAAIAQNHVIRRMLTETLDCGVENTAIHKGFPLVFDNFLGDNIEVQEIIDRSYQGGSFGVPLFQEQIRRDFKKLELHEKNDKSDTASAIVGSGKDRISEINLLVATLIATVTFAAALAPPGGYGDNGKMILQQNTNFQIFQTFNTISFIFSLTVLLLEAFKAYWGSKFPNFLRLKPGGLIMGSLVGMIFAFPLGSAAGQITVKKTTPVDGWIILLICVFSFSAMSPKMNELVTNRGGAMLGHGGSRAPVRSSLYMYLVSYFREKLL
ncbi:ankyrin repeat-containing protein At5g02620-like [Rosa rugosa]|uniref:ankyrin repeat-containing protein At5g02620-like n=1 Tax=Rosa rugosa TaxID=74645 RepID=UPI002B41109B|nr:ankyrin repeat-containing protein At5g02620-like [Rosa rugosa]